MMKRRSVVEHCHHPDATPLNDQMMLARREIRSARLELFPTRRFNHFHLADLVERAANAFVNPAGMSYPQLYAAIEPALAPVGGSLWVRKMTLGPSPEMCVLAREPRTLAPQFQMFAFQLRPIWDGSLASTGAR